MKRRDKAFSNSEDMFTQRAQRAERRRTGQSAQPFYIDEESGHRAASAAARGICRYLKVAVWRSEGMYRLRGQHDSKLLYLYLITGPHTLACHVPGIYQVGRETIREELGFPQGRFKKAMCGLTKELMVEADFGRSLVFAPTALDHIGPPANPNIVRSYCQMISNLPKSILVDKVVELYRPFLSSLGQSFIQPFRDRFPMVCSAQAEPFVKLCDDPSTSFCTEREKEKEIEKETQKRPFSELDSDFDPDDEHIALSSRLDFEGSRLRSSESREHGLLPERP